MEDKKQTLIDLAQEQQRIMSLIYSTMDKETGEIDSILDYELGKVEQGLAIKVDGYKEVMDRLEHEVAIWSEKADAMAQIANQLENTRERMRERLKAAMLIQQRDDLRGVNHRFKIIKGAPKVVIDETKLPSEYKKQIVTIVPDKDAIKAALKEGKEIAGAFELPVYQLRSYINKGDK